MNPYILLSAFLDHAYNIMVGYWSMLISFPAILLNLFIASNTLL